MQDLQKNYEGKLSQKNIEISTLKVKLADSLSQQQFIQAEPLHFCKMLRKSRLLLRTDNQDMKNQYSPATIIENSQCQKINRNSSLEPNPNTDYPFKQYQGLEELKANETSVVSRNKQLRNFQNILKHSRSFSCLDEFKKTRALDQQLYLNHLINYKDNNNEGLKNESIQCEISKERGDQDEFSSPSRTKDANVGKNSLPSQDMHSIGVGSTPRLQEREDSEEQLSRKSQKQQMIEYYVKHIKIIIFIQRKFREKLLKRWMEEKSAAHKMSKSMKKKDCTVF